MTWSINRQELTQALAYLQKHADWLNTNEFDKLYQNAQSTFIENVPLVTCLTQVLLTSGITIDPISKIYSQMFSMLSISAYTIPESAEIIDTCAFWGCENLVTMNIPEGITNIRGMAFRHCIHLTNVTLPKSLREIDGHDIFSDCDNLENVIFPATNLINNLDGPIFSNCPKLKHITYLGKKEAVHACAKDSWLYDTDIDTIDCSDGIINLY